MNLSDRLEGGTHRGRIYRHQWDLPQHGHRGRERGFPPGVPSHGREQVKRKERAGSGPSNLLRVHRGCSILRNTSETLVSM